jgi:predicted ribosomally synthesized peptide with nif11-like leader
MMENKIMINFTPELIAKAKAAESAEALLALAKENGVDLTEDEAKTCFEQLHANTEISDDELEAVSGGGICQDIKNFFLGRNGRNDDSCPYCDDRPEVSAMPVNPTFDSSIKTIPHTSRPGDTDGKIKFL